MAFAQQTFTVKYLPTPHIVPTTGKQQSTNMSNQQMKQRGENGYLGMSRATSTSRFQGKEGNENREKQESVFIILLLLEQ